MKLIAFLFISTQICELMASEGGDPLLLFASIENVDVVSIQLEKGLKDESDDGHEVLHKGKVTLVTALRGLEVKLEDALRDGISREWNKAIPISTVEMPMAAPDRIAIVLEGSHEGVRILSFVAGIALVSKGRRVVSGVYQFDGESFVVTDPDLVRELASICHEVLNKLADVENGVGLQKSTETADGESTKK